MIEEVGPREGDQGDVTALPPSACVRLVSCGRPGTGVRVAIVDPITRVRLADGVVGEVWVTSESKAAGYWGRVDLSQDVFHAKLVRAAEDTASSCGDEEDGWLRTGDQGVLVRGELYLTGRLKDLIIVRGRNLYPQVGPMLCVCVCVCVCVMLLYLLLRSREGFFFLIRMRCHVQDIEKTVENSAALVRPGCTAAFSELGSEQGHGTRLAVCVEVEMNVIQMSCGVLAH